ncbi:protein FLUORESCENT IN BLUE LIGHT, chloroplastic isoform X2 [Momordica charantia]|uniref:Protein FLUORESCENT IN BLUE LIGHT, chloroplastic isoform X2 n=1 Tax=Momordica charantia TaxID=3673 RepID=A0A6J1D4T4_MOMCH|nr:protein FLUORESCENT IN BLUE LIGHT, chloroplastic isoform X2 [Momordica charantia]
MAMAVAMRCSCFLSRPNSPRSPPSDHLSTKIFFSGKMPHISLNLDNVVTFCGENLCRPLGVKNLLPLLKCQGNIETRLPVMAFLFTNVFAFSIPLKALAETCEAENSGFNMPILLSVALVGATVGGLLARQRRGELKRLNEQLRQINAALRRQAKIESYAPALSYAPVGGRIPENEVIVDPRKEELISRLKSGKNFLRNQDPEKAFVEFKTALELAQVLNDPIEEKKAARGLGASLQRQGKYREAIKYHSMVMAISEREGEQSGNTEAFGAIADCYTELGDLEKAAYFYDKYIARLETD